MDLYSGYINRLIAELAVLPGIGNKSAQRLAFHIINMPKEQVEKLANAMNEYQKLYDDYKYLDKAVKELPQKNSIPSYVSASHELVNEMVVENTRDMTAYEKTHKYEGVYHVLHGAINPSMGIGPSDIRLAELLKRLQKDVDEVIIATNSSIEGETTAMYISKLIKPTGIKVTRIASGVPVGGELEYIDEVTLSRALDARVEL